jgi:hypothetical protein
VVLGPADVHAREHLRPVLALRAAGTGVHLEVGVVTVGFARKHRLHLLPARLRGKLAQPRLPLLDGGGIAFRLAKLDQRDGIVELALELLVAGNRPLQRLALAHDLLGGLRIAPEVGVLGPLIQLGQARGRAIPVKDASATGQATGGWPRQAFRLRRAWAAPDAELL